MLHYNNLVKTVGVCLEARLLHIVNKTDNSYPIRYHFYYIPKREQSYQMLQMAVSMCVDLGLNLRPQEAVNRKVGLRLAHYDKATAACVEHDDYFSREARRAFIGCYYLSTT